MEEMPCGPIYQAADKLCCLMDVAYICVDDAF